MILTAKGLSEIKSIPPAPLFEQAIQDAISELESVVDKGTDVPIPKDMGGGYTHEQHKRNYRYMLLAGALYQILEEVRYASFVKRTLFTYADLYKNLPLHPAEKSYARGKLFWQCLNEANWLVYTSQAYDCIYEYLSKQERQTLETELFKPFADFLSIENPRFFNRIHNHSTWGNAAVGMMGIAMRDEELVQRALYGLDLPERDLGVKDNDGGYIYEEGKATAGFFAQIDHAFSPDGYYTEGPYYQRYAMTPFLLFAQSLDTYNLDLQIFAYRDSLLIKAVSALLHQTSASGAFFPLNDAQKGMSIHANSVITAVNIAFGQDPNPQLVRVARQQGKVSLDQNGAAIAKAIQKAEGLEVEKPSVLLRDGAKGKQGGLAILRSKNITVPVKCTAQGLGHGHYDKLSISVYDGETEVLQDYGAARWVNIDQKAGGRYLPENNSWAKQSIAHNTLVVNQRSHFGGEYALASENHSEILFTEFQREELQFVMAKETHAYKGIELYRGVILWTNAHFKNPLLIDLTYAISDQAHQYDLPFHHAGQFLQANFDLEMIQPPAILGESHGYEHVYQEALGSIEGEMLQFSWMKDRRFYTISSIAEDKDQAILARIGANDPSFNLRRDPFLIHRKRHSRNPIFLTVIEAHGTYDPVSELPEGLYTSIQSIDLMYHDADYSLFSISTKENKKWTFMLAHQASNRESLHQIQIDNLRYEWQGPIHLFSQP
ncbi:MAG: heparinase II/III family protein [Bacteroidota bacterium]